VFGPDKETGDDTLIEVFTSEKEAEQWLGGGLLQSAMERLSSLKPGGTFSLLLTRGKERIRMSGSYAITNPNAERETKEWRVEHMTAVRSPVE